MDANGRSIKEAERYGKPCIGARYTGEDVHEYAREQGALCVVCGAMATDVHHWPPIGRSAHGEWTLRTPTGWHVLRPALFALCRHCHNRFHDGTLTADWAWNTEEDRESWWHGDMVRSIAPHSLRLYEHGRWNFYDPRYRRGFSYREEVTDDGRWKKVRGQIREEPAPAAGGIAQD